MCYFNTFGSYPIAATVSELYFSNFWNLIVVSPFHFLLSNTIQTDFLAKATCCIFVEKVQRSLFIYCCDCLAQSEDRRLKYWRCLVSVCKFSNDCGILLASHPKSICMEDNVKVDSNLPYLSEKIPCLAVITHLLIQYEAGHTLACFKTNHQSLFALILDANTKQLQG